jgi:hypothetical protein
MLGIEQQDHDLGETDGLQRIADGEFFGASFNPHLAP